MKSCELEKMAKAAGFSQAVVIATDKFVFKPEYRKFCEDNLCGNYGKNYGCPPVCGTPEEMKKIALSYPWALVLQSKTKVENAFDDAVTKKLKKKHTAMTLQIIKEIKETYQTRGIPIMAGPCNFCAVCKLQDGIECSHRDMKFSCLSAYCIDVNSLAQECEIEMEWSKEEVSLFSIYLYKSAGEE